MYTTILHFYREIAKAAEEIKKYDAPVMYDGLLWPPFPGIYPEPERKFQERLDMECRDSDTFLCSFPKAG